MNTLPVAGRCLGVKLIAFAFVTDQWTNKARGIQQIPRRARSGLHVGGQRLARLLRMLGAKEILPIIALAFKAAGQQPDDQLFGKPARKARLFPRSWV